MNRNLSISKLLISIGLFCLMVAVVENAKSQVTVAGKYDHLKTGDIIFQSSLSEQSKAIELATHSEYTHCGLIYKEGNHYYVYEAVQPVTKTPLDSWIANGTGGHFVVKRLRNADKILTDETLGKMKKAGEAFKGKNYDIHFKWSDDRIYCSELVWKIYQRATGIEIGKLQKLREFDLSHEIVKKALAERYHKNIPLDETVISPKSIFDSELLITIKTD